MDIYLAPDVPVTGTLIWYLHVCPREVWFMSRGITPYAYHRRLEYGRAVHQRHSDTVPLSLEGIKIDKFDRESNVVIEIKSMSRHLESARAQLSYYLFRLSELGLKAKGQVWVPDESLTEEIDNFNEDEVRNDVEKVKEIVSMETPPQRKWIKFCKKCAYRGLCWGDER
ncbi:CRISPR-associated protein Cas4 [Sulfolobales archaeon HS-7]|nr:CRISPR-associated protein Cas4 [Sulfolobales archaeon HS-7]